MEERDDQAWWYQRDPAPAADDPWARAAPTSAPNLPGPGPAPTGPPGDGEEPGPGMAAPGRHGWARSPGTYVPSVVDKGANKSIVLGVIGLFVCGIFLGPAAISEGIQARRRIAASGGGLSGNARAVVGICIGSVATFFAALGLLAIVISIVTA